MEDQTVRAFVARSAPSRLVRTVRAFVARSRSEFVYDVPSTKEEGVDEIDGPIGLASLKLPETAFDRTTSAMENSRRTEEQRRDFYIIE